MSSWELGHGSNIRTQLELHAKFYYGERTNITIK